MCGSKHTVTGMQRVHSSLPITYGTPADGERAIKLQEVEQRKLFLELERLARCKADMTKT